jgi:hypothetical protein
LRFNHLHPSRLSTWALSWSRHVNQIYVQLLEVRDIIMIMNFDVWDAGYRGDSCAVSFRMIILIYRMIILIYRMIILIYRILFFQNLGLYWVNTILVLFILENRDKCDVFLFSSSFCMKCYVVLVSLSFVKSRSCLF